MVLLLQANREGPTQGERMSVMQSCKKTDVCVSGRTAIFHACTYESATTMLQLSSEPLTLQRTGFLAASRHSIGNTPYAHTRRGACALAHLLKLPY